MLVHLRVRDLVLIEELDLELSPGFNVLTGETGAGKSLLVTAVDLLLGRRASSDLVRKDAGEAEVEGLFDIHDEGGVRARLAAAGLPVDDELVIRRVVPADGRHRCYINGRLSSLGILSDLAEGLASVMSQHEHHTLMEPASQLAMIDGFGGHGDLLLRMARAHADLKEAAAALSSLETSAKDRAGRVDYLQFQIREIGELAPLPGELDQLDREISVLRHQGILLDTARRGAEELYESDGSVFEKLGALCRALDDVTRFDESLVQDSRQLSEAAVLVEEAARSLAAYGSRLEADPAALDAMEERREALRRLVRKHGTDLDGVIALRDSLAAELDGLTRYEESLLDARGRVERLGEIAAREAAALTSARRRAGARLAKAVTKELADLSFEKAVFEVVLGPREGGPSTTGADRAEFRVALNPGEGGHALRKVASGGELSRMMLALRRVLAGVGPVGTYVFDEVDAGIGGPVATAVGSKLSEVGDHHQVICITHLPQICAMASTHYHVSKRERDGRTVTTVERLDGERRIEEVARMLGGARVTPKIRAAAAELFGKAPRGR